MEKIIVMVSNDEELDKQNWLDDREFKLTFIGLLFREKITT